MVYGTQRRQLGDKDISAYGLQCSAPRSGQSDMWNIQHVPVIPVSSIALTSSRFQAGDVLLCAIW